MFAATQFALSFVVLALAAAVAQGAASSDAFVGLDGSSLMISAPVGGNVVISNFTELEVVKSQLSSAMSTIQVLQDSQTDRISDTIWPGTFNVSFTFLQTLTSALKIVVNDLQIGSNDMLTSVSFPWLQSIGGSLVIFNNQILASISFPNLQIVRGYVWITYKTPGLSPVVDLSKLNLTQPAVQGFNVSNEYVLGNMSCLAKFPTNCETLHSIALIGGNQGSTIRTYTYNAPTWPVSATLSLPSIRTTYIFAGFHQRTYSYYVAGGSDGVNPLRTAGYLNAQTGQWSDLPPMTTPRANTAGSFISNATGFLVFGGINGNDVLNTTEVYNITTGMWFMSDSFTNPRHSHAVVLTEDYFVIVGGKDSKGAAMDSVENFYVSSYSNYWSSSASLPQPRAALGAAYLAHNIYVVGGMDSAGNPIDSAIYFDSNSYSWVSMPTLPSGARAQHTAVAFKNRLVVIGGNVNTVDVYDPVTNSWSNNVFAALPTQLTYISSVVL